MGSDLRTWEVHTHTGEVLRVSATRVEFDNTTNRVTFFDGEEVLAGFTGLNAFLPVS